MKKNILWLIIISNLFINFTEADELLDGFVDIDGSRYYYNNGIEQTGVQYIDGNYFYFAEDGKMQYGVTDGIYYYGKQSGTRQYNYQWDQDQNGSIDYYFGNDGQKVKNTWMDIDLDGKDDYYFGNDGKAVDGVQEIEGVFYYFKDNKKQYEATDGAYYYGRLTGTRQRNYWWDQDKDGNNDYYFGSDYKIVNGVQRIDGNYYYFIENKKQYAVTDGTYYYGRLTGTRQYNYYWSQNFDGKYDYYFGSDGKIEKNTWMDIDLDGKYDYYFNNDGKSVDGIQEIEGVFYYFKDNKKQYEATDGTYYYGRLTGTRQRNYWWDQDKDGNNDYYFGSDYKIVDGVKEIEGIFYYFKDNKKQYEATDGTYYYGRLTGTRQRNYWWDQDKDGNNDYYFGSDYKIVDGVQEIEGKYYYFVDNKKQYAVTDGTYYYGRLTGTRQYNYMWDCNQDGIYDYYFGNDGKQQKNTWYDYNLDGKDDYYFDVTGKILNGVQEVNGKYYYFIDYIKQYGVTDGLYYYGRQTGSRQYNYWWDCELDGKKEYYFDENGMKVIGSQEIDGKYYYFDNNGKMQYGVFIEIDGKKYYYGKISGTRQFGWLVSYGNVYYFDKNTGEMATGNITIDGVSYKFDSNGIWQAGWVYKEGKRYYYYLDGTMATGWVMIAGIKCYFNENGELIQEGALKIIDVSAHQGLIDWNSVANNTDVDGAIIRMGYGTSYVTDAPVEDKYFQVNYNNALKQNLLFGVYLYSYAINATSASIEAEFVINLLKQQNFDKNKIIYYDLESNAWTKNLKSTDYDSIINTFINKLSSAGYKVQIYTYKYWAETKLSDYGKLQLGWIAQYSSNCTYNGSYNGWQYTDSGNVTGIANNVDISVWKK